jgi:hypothetical protein
MSSLHGLAERFDVGFLCQHNLGERIDILSANWTAIAVDALEYQPSP